MLTITLLGTGSPLPDPNRAGPATLISSQSSHYLVDAGRGVLMRLAATDVVPGQLSAVLLTHLHSDHFTDLNDVITSRGILPREPRPLTIVGPVGTEKVVDHILGSLALDIEYRMTHHDDLTQPPQVQVLEVTAGSVELPGDVLVTCAQADHKSVEPSVGFRFDAGGARCGCRLARTGSEVLRRTY